MQLFVDWFLFFNAELAKYESLEQLRSNKSIRAIFENIQKYSVLNNSVLFEGIRLGHVSADCDITINSLSNIERGNHSPAIET